MRAHLALLHQPLQEKSLEQRRETGCITHAGFPQRCSRRRIASRMSSGEPLKYHWVSATWTCPRNALKRGRRRSGSSLERYQFTKVDVANRCLKSWRRGPLLSWFPRRPICREAA